MWKRLFLNIYINMWCWRNPKPSAIKTQQIQQKLMIQIWIPRNHTLTLIRLPRDRLGLKPLITHGLKNILWLDSSAYSRSKSSSIDVRTSMAFINSRIYVGFDPTTDSFPFLLFLLLSQDQSRVEPCYSPYEWVNAFLFWETLLFPLHAIVPEEGRKCLRPPHILHSHYERWFV